MTTDEALGLAIDELAARVTAVEADLADLQLGRRAADASGHRVRPRP